MGFHYRITKEEEDLFKEIEAEICNELYEFYLIAEEFFDLMNGNIYEEED